MTRWLLAAALACGASTASAQRASDTVFIVPGGHLDLGFTGPISQVRSQRIGIIDAAIDAATRDRGFRWFEEGGWAVEQWLDYYHNDPMRIARLRMLVERGQIGIGATLLSPHGAAFPGALKLLTLHLDRVQHELGRRPTVAVVNDVPAVPEAIVDALAAAGIRYLMMGANLVFSPPLPARVTRGPFYWQSSHGARVLVSIDPDGYGAGLTHWLLPPACLRLFDPSAFPPSLSDDSILSLGVGRELALRHMTRSLLLVQHSTDNGGPDCAAGLPAAAREWNRRPNVPRLVIAMPELYFQHLEAHAGSPLPVLRGEWGGDWDLLRMSEPVWSWRLRRAIAALTPASSRALRLAAVEVTDHNVGLGPRWQDGSSVAVAEAHMREVAALYRSVVSGALGQAALTSLPPPIPAPPPGAWPAAWQAIVGGPTDVARVRAGRGFIYPFVNDSYPAVVAPADVHADRSRLVVHVAIDRVAFERQLGARYQAVIEVTLHAPIRELTIAPEGSADARAGRWLLGTPAQRIVAPEGVRVTGPGWTFHAHGPLLIGWALTPDPRNPALTRLQALAVVHAVDGVVTGGQHLRLPFAEMYAGEPATPMFDLELRRGP